MVFFNQFTAGKNSAHKITAVLNSSVDLNREKIASIPDKITFVHTTETSFWAKKYRLEKFLVLHRLGHTGTKFACSRIKKNCLFSIKLKDCFKSCCKIGNSIILESTSGTVVKLKKEKVFIKLSEFRIVLESPCCDGLTDDWAEFIIDHGRSKCARQR